MPEVTGFKLGVDPYDFTLHVTIDNADNGNARRACRAAWDEEPKIGDAQAYWSACAPRHA